MRAHLIVSMTLCVALSGCGGASNPTDASQASATATSAQAEPVTCTGLPDFVALYDGAKISLCTKGDTSGTSTAAQRTSGTILFTVPAAPAAVLAWYHDKARQGGMADGLVTETSYSARAPHRNFMVMTEADGAGTKVTLNWGADGPG